MNDEEVREYKKHLRCRSVDSLRTLRKWFFDKRSERDREQKLMMINDELERRNKAIK